nr:MAG TPA: portal protein [Caudoviricetes sp.]
MTTGRLDQRTQRVKGWEQASIEYTSAFVTNIHNKIASEIAKVNFNHVQYEINPLGADTMKTLQGSDIDEVLNWSPKGQPNSTEFWRQMVKKLLLSKKVTLVPTWKNNGVTVELTDLQFLGDSTNYNENSVINIVSPFYTDAKTSILDNALSSISEKLNQGKLRGFLEVNANLDNGATSFKKKALETIQLMQEVSTYNGIGVKDAKSTLVELKNNYSVLNQEEIDLIKKELLSAYFMSENILLGTASQEEQMAFYSNTILPILTQLEKELTYKLLTTQERRITRYKKYYERIVIDNQIMKFATIKDLISFWHENTNAPTLMVNEMRLLMGMNPTEGGDVYLTNKNSVAIKSFTDISGTGEIDRKENDQTIETDSKQPSDSNPSE